MLFGESKANITRMKSGSVWYSSLLFIFNMPCPPSYDILFFLQPLVEHGFVVHDVEYTVLSTMCLGGGGNMEEG